MPKYTQDDWDRFQGLLGTGLSGGAALRSALSIAGSTARPHQPRRSRSRSRRAPGLA